MAPHTLVLGMSHVEAISLALENHPDPGFQVLNLNREPAIYDVGTNRLDLSAFHDPRPDRVCLSLGGNFHNIFGLLELPQPIRIGCDGGAVPDDPARNFLPHDLMRAHFERRLERPLQHAGAVHDRFAGARFLWLCAPPPIADEAHLRANPGVFRARMHLGLAPRDLRLALHAMQRDIYAARARAAGAEFLDPPVAARDAAGFLERAFWADDPTHGNAAYGRLVIEQIRAKEALAA